ncbi:hypothetical protein F4808DRAFT_52225 [Astrocystis sublimbata]|nr:hypothetical protein F4808DRAFT_52225 [Astrocystis sublimbata]
MLRIFLFKHEMEIKEQNTRDDSADTFTRYIEAATVEILQPEPVSSDLTTWRYSCDLPREGYDPDHQLPGRIMMAISFMHNVTYISLYIERLDERQAATWDGVIKQCQPWWQVKTLRLVTDGTSDDVASQIIAKMVPRLRGLDITIGWKSKQFMSALAAHKNLEKLDFCFDEGDCHQCTPTRRLAPFCPHLAQKIAETFVHLVHLTIHADPNKQSFLNQGIDIKGQLVVPFANELVPLTKLERLCISSTAVYQHSINLGWHGRVANTIGGILPTVNQIAVKRRYPDYFAYTRKGSEFVGVNKDITTQLKGSWPGIRDE